jgi:hypothetical protein
MRKLFVWATGIQKGLAAHSNVLLVNTLGLVASGLIVKGVAGFSEPAAWIVAGVGLMLATAVLSRTPKT